MCVCLYIHTYIRRLRLLTKDSHVLSSEKAPKSIFLNFRIIGLYAQVTQDSVHISLAESTVDFNAILTFMAFRGTFISKKGDLM